MERDQNRESRHLVDVVNTSIHTLASTPFASSSAALSNENDFLNGHPTIQLAIVSNHASFQTDIEQLIDHLPNTSIIGVYDNLYHLERMLSAPCIIVVELLAEEQHEMLATVQRLEDTSASRFNFMVITPNNNRSTVEECLYAGVRSVIPMARLTQSFEQGINALRAYNIFITLWFN